MTSTTTATGSFASPVTTPDQLRNFYVYVVNRKFYGYDPALLPKRVLKEYDREQVKTYVQSVFGGANHVFFDDEMTSNTNLLIVPDHWNRKLPTKALLYKPNLFYLPFSYVLFPNATTVKEMQNVTPPVDAAYQLFLQEQKQDESDVGTFQLSKVASDKILKRFQGWRIDDMRFRGATPDMVNTRVKAVTQNPTKEEMERVKSATRKPTKEEIDRAHQEAWDKLMARAQDMQ